MTPPGWKDVLPVPPRGGRLHEAWMTSFEQPDAGLLVEHLLPSLLGMSYSLSQEVQEQTLFFGELGTALEALHGKITVISTPPRGTREDSQYPWLWRYVGHFTVGAVSREVQHAKLWAFHWTVDDDEFLELHVSSTNLTMSAVKGQIQAGWQKTLQLKSRPHASIRKSWGELMPFLEALGISAGSVASSRVQRLIALLDRVECPADVTFIASIPGGRSAASQLKQFKTSEVHVMTPTIGDWNNRTLKNWSNDVGIAIKQVRLKWISTQHPWAESAGWTLSAKAKTVLETHGVNVECLPNGARFTKQHLEADARWSHAKLYLLRSKKKRRLLVTSANWSASAWGAGNTAPRNFELGVVFESTWSDLETIAQKFEPPNTVPFCVERTEADEDSSSLEWAEATWDGKHIVLRARSKNATAQIIAVIGFSSGFEQEHALAGDVASVSWDEAERTPLIVIFKQGDDILEVDVIDLRLAKEFAKTPLPEVDPTLAATLREAFLLQRYGGPAVDIDAISTLRGKRLPSVVTPVADYSVHEWNEARAAFHIVDQWSAALDKAKVDPMLLERVRLDGHELRTLYARREGPAASLVAEELGWRIEKDT